MSYAAPFMVRHRELDGPRAVRDTANPGWQEIDVHTRSAVVLFGRVMLSNETYLSGGPPEIDLLKQWTPERGWSVSGMGAVAAGPRWFAWREHQRLLLGAGYTRVGGGGYTVPPVVVHVPLWLVCVLAATPLAWHFSPVQRRARRRERGLCQKCGYARAGLAEGAACPECGDKCRRA